MIQTAIVLALLAANAPTIDIQGYQTEIETPVRYQGELPERFFEPGKSYELTGEIGGKQVAIPLQTSARFDHTLFFIMPPAEDQSIQLTVREKASEPAFRFVEKEGKYLYVFEKDRPIHVYNFAPIPDPNVFEPQYHSCYIHPIYGLDREILSGDYPSDHYHHRGLYFGWPRLRIDGGMYDNWSLRNMQYRFEKFLYRETGPVCALYGIQSGCYIGDKRVMEEIVHYATYPTNQIGRVLDVTVEWRAIGTDIEILGEPNKGYGGFNLRYAFREGTEITTSTGLQQEDVLHQTFPWSDLSAKFDGREKPSGMSVFQDRNNPDYPAIWILRHYGFQGVCWPGMKTAILKQGEESVQSRFRVWIHRGDAKEGQVNNAYDAFDNPYKKISIQ